MPFIKEEWVKQTEAYSITPQDQGPAASRRQKKIVITRCIKSKFSDASHYPGLSEGIKSYLWPWDFPCIHLYDFGLKIKIGKVREKLTMAFNKLLNKTWVRNISYQQGEEQVGAPAIFW